MNTDKFTIDDTVEHLQHLLGKLLYGCMDGACCIEKPKGQHTNGGCQCYPKTIVRDLKRLAEAIESNGENKWTER